MKVLLLSSLVVSAMAYSMSIVAKTNSDMCLDLLGERTVDGTPIDIWQCTAGLLGQQWFFDAGTFTIRSAVNDKKCIDASGPSLSLNDCSTDKVSPGQTFGWDIKTTAIYLTPDKGDLKPGSMCMTMPEKGKQGAVLALAPCKLETKPIFPGNPLDGNTTTVDPLQQWMPVVGPPPSTKNNDTFYISPGNDTRRCLSVDLSPMFLLPPDSDLWNGVHVVVSSESIGCGGFGAFAQQWIFTEGSYRISPANLPSKCIDATSMAKGNPLVLWDCNGFPQQQWGYEQAKGKTTGTVYLTQPPAGNPECLSVGQDKVGGEQVASLGDCSTQWQLKKVPPKVGSEITIV